MLSLQIIIIEISVYRRIYKHVHGVVNVNLIKIRSLTCSTLLMCRSMRHPRKPHYGSYACYRMSWIYNDNYGKYSYKHFRPIGLPIAGKEV